MDTNAPPHELHYALLTLEGLTRTEHQRKALRDVRNALTDGARDTKRIDWLADTDNMVGNVQLPREIVEANVHSLRAAIDAAMAANAKCLACLYDTMGRSSTT